VVTVELPSDRRRPLRRRRSSARWAAAALVVVIAAGLGGAWVWLRGSLVGVPLREHCLATTSTSIADLDPEQAGNAALITALAVKRRLPARAATIALATAMQESKLYNLDYGDRDSVGLFQQRPSQGWGTREQVLDPVHAANAFYDALVKIDGYQSMEITKAAQKVQRSAYPAAYAEHEPAARALASALTGNSPGAFSCVLNPPAAPVAQRAGAAGLTPRAADVVAAAAAQTGLAGVAAPANTDAGQVAGTRVQFITRGADAGGTAWALAHWAVAQAAALAVVSVSVDGRQWRRQDVEAGWQPSSGGAEAATGSATVVVEVAAGA
jgi:hypothetical protein